MILNRSILNKWLLAGNSEQLGEWLLQACAAWNSTALQEMKAVKFYPFFIPPDESPSAYLVNFLHGELTEATPFFRLGVGHALSIWTTDMRLLCLRELMVMAGRLGSKGLDDVGRRAFSVDNVAREDRYHIEQTLTELVQALSFHPSFALSSVLADFVDELRKRQSLWRPVYSMPLIKSLVERRPQDWLRPLAWLSADIRILAAQDTALVNRVFNEIFGQIDLEFIRDALTKLPLHEQWMVPLLFAAEHHKRPWRPPYRVSSVDGGKALLERDVEAVPRGSTTVTWDLQATPQHVAALIKRYGVPRSGTADLFAATENNIIRLVDASVERLGRSDRDHP